MEFSACIGFCDIGGELESKINKHSNGAVYALCMS